MFDEDFDPDYDPATEQRLYQATPTMEAHTADEGRRVHVHVVDGAGGQLHAWGAAPDAVITARDPQHGPFAVLGTGHCERHHHALRSPAVGAVPHVSFPRGCPAVVP